LTLELHDNIFVSTAAGIAYLGNESAEPGGTHNVWFGAGAPPTGEQSPIADDPMFVDPDALDFHLQDGSPAKNTGVAQSIAELDFDGMPRDANAWSIGPFQ
ncbi:MAG TPA: hypothetical protein VG755_29805, partial [Nannocystaceae bacterium]|nr:hypothetical protein [Nannocystaceae bacterium]